MALPVGVTSALAHIDAPVSFGGTPAKVYLEIVPNIRLNHIATGTPLANFIDVRTPGLGDPATVTLPHTDQTGFQDESGLPVVNWSYAATIRYELDGQLIHVPTKNFQILTGQTDIDLALIPVGEPAEIIMGNVAFVSSLNGRSGAVTLTPQDAGLFADPGADRIVFWDDSASQFAALQPTSPLVISGSGLSVSAATESVSGRVELATSAETATGTDNTRAVHPLGLKAQLDLKNEVIAKGYRSRLPGDDPTVYPVGISNFLASTADGWAWPDGETFKQVITFRQSFGTGGGTLQVASSYTDNSRPPHFRNWDSDDVAWGAWYIFASRTYVDAADALKANIASPTFTGTVAGITATMVGLGSVNNTSDAAKPVSTAQQTALNLKANIASPTFTGTVGGITKSMVGLGSVDNTADTAKPVSTAQQTALNGKVNKGDLSLSATDYGVVADGVTDDTTFLQAALTALAAAPGRTLVLPKGGTVKLTAPLGTYELSNTILDLNGSVIDASGVTGATSEVLRVSGSAGSAVALTANLADKTKVVTVGSTTGFAAGDMVFITCTTIFDPNRTGAKYGELNYVETVDSATQITLKMEANAAYLTSATATITKITPVQNFTIRGGSIISNTTANTLAGIYVNWGRNIQMERVTIRGINRAQVTWKNVSEGRIAGSRFSVAAHVSQAYGTSMLDATQDIIITGNHYSEVRHSMSTNNTIADGGITRRITFIGNNVTDSAPATGGTGGDAIDTHAGSEEIFVIGNTVNSSSGSGLNMEARSGTVVGNTFNNCTNYGMNIIPYSVLPGSWTIADNRMNNVYGLYGLNFNITQADVMSATITGNTFEGASLGAKLTATSPYFIRGLVLGTNRIHCAAGTAAQLVRCLNATVGTNSVRSGTTIAMQVDTCDSASITGNMFEIYGTSGATGNCLSLQGTMTRNAISGNTFVYSATGITSARGAVLANTVTNTGVWANVGTGLAATSVLGTGTGNVAANNI